MSHFFTLNNIPLRVNQDKGVSVVSGLNIHTTQLKPNDEKHSATHFNNTGYEGKEFEVTLVIKESDYYNGKKVLDILEELIMQMKVVSIVTKALDVPNSKYVIINDKREQNFENITNWTLKFKQLYSTKTYTNSIYKKATTTPIKKPSSSTLNSKLKKCSVPLSVNSKGKCVIYLKKKLKQKGYFKGDVKSNVYNKKLANSVKALQGDYKKKYNLKTNGVFDKKTKKCLLKI